MSRFLRRPPYLPPIGTFLAINLPGYMLFGASTMLMMPTRAGTMSPLTFALGVLGSDLPVLGALLGILILRRTKLTAPAATVPSWRGWISYYGLTFGGGLVGFLLYEWFLQLHFTLPADPWRLYTLYVVTPAVGIAGLIWFEDEAAYRARSAEEQVLLTERNQRLFVTREALALAGSRRMLEAASGQAEQLMPRLQVIASTLRKARVSGDPAGLAEAGDELARVAEDYRLLSHALHPSAADVGLVPVLSSLARLHETEREVSLAVAVDVDDEVACLSSGEVLNAYRILEAAFDNIARHSAARRVTLTLTRATSGVLLLSVADNGVGFEVTARPWGLGLAAIDSRVALAGWQWNLTSEPGAGTRLQVWLQPTRSG